MRRRRARAVAAVVATLMLCGAATLRAGELRVALVVATRSEAGTDEAPTVDGRIRAELIAGGLDVITLVEARESNRTTLKAAAARTQSIAAVSTASDEGVAVASVWLTAGEHREARLAHVEVLGDGDERDRLLALRVADLLYANLVELEPLRKKRERGERIRVDARSPEARPPSRVPAQPKPSPAEQPPDPPLVQPGVEKPPTQVERPRYAVSLGGTYWPQGFGTGDPGLQPTGAPMAAGGWWTAPRWRLGAIASGPAIAQVDIHPLGEARVIQALIAAEVQFVVLQTGDLAVHASGAGGVYLMAATGREALEGQYEGTSDYATAPVALVGTGCRVLLHGPVSFVVRADAALVTRNPKLEVKVSDTEGTLTIAHTALPLLLASAGFEMAW